MMCILVHARVFYYVSPQKSRVFYKKRHQIGNVNNDVIVLKKIIPVAYFSSPPYFAESNAVVIGAGIPAMITVMPLSIGSIG